MMISSPNIVGVRTSTAGFADDLHLASPRSPRRPGVARSFRPRSPSCRPGCRSRSLPGSSGCRRFRPRPSGCRQTAWTAESSGHDQRRPADCPQDEQHGDDQQAAVEQIVAGGDQHLVDQVAAGVKLRFRRPAGSSFFDFFDLVPQPLGDLAAVLAQQHEAQAQHDFALAVGGDGAAGIRGRFRRRPRRGPGSAGPRGVDDDAGDFGHAGHQADPLHQLTLPPATGCRRRRWRCCARTAASTSSSVSSYLASRAGSNRT